MYVFRSSEFKSSFSLTALNFADFPRRLGKVSISAAIRISMITEQKFLSRTEDAVSVLLFGAVEIGILRVFGKQQSHHVISLTLDLRLLFDVYQRVQDMFQNAFEKLNLSLPIINARACMQLIVFSAQKSEPVNDGADKEGFKVVLLSSTFEVPKFFHALYLLNKHKKMMNA